MSKFIKKFETPLLALLLVSLLVLLVMFLIYVATYENEDKKSYMYYVKEEIEGDILSYEIISKGKEDIFETVNVELIVETVVSTTHNTLVTKRFYVYIEWYCKWSENNVIEKVQYNFRGTKTHDRPFLREKISDIEIKEIVK